MQTQKIRIFSPHLEKIYFICLSVFTFCFALDMLGFWPNTSRVLSVEKFLAGFIFGNAVHVGFTFALIACLPEFRHLFLDKMKTKIGLLVIGMLGITLFYFVQTQVLGNREGSSVFFSRAILYAFFTVHSLSQTKGLSLLYNQNHRFHLDSVELNRHLQCERRERFLFQAYIALQLFTLALNLIFPSQKFEVRMLHFGVSLLLTSAIFINSFFYPKIQNSNKRFYLISLFSLPFVDISILGFFINQAIHGLEYGLLTMHVTAKSKTHGRNWRALGMVFGVLCTYVVFFFSQDQISFEFKRNSPLLTTWMTGAAYTMAYLHYVLDGQLFRFKDPAVRTHLSSLLVSEMPPIRNETQEKAS